MIIIFTFGYGQTDPQTGKSLANRYVRVEAPDRDAAAERMIDRFGHRYPGRALGKPHHDHICHDCGRSVLPRPEIAGEGTEAPCVPPRATDAEATTVAPLPGPDDDDDYLPYDETECAFCCEVDCRCDPALGGRP